MESKAKRVPLSGPSTTSTTNARTASATGGPPGLTTVEGSSCSGGPLILRSDLPRRAHTDEPAVRLGPRRRAAPGARRERKRGRGCGEAGPADGEADVADEAEGVRMGGGVETGTGVQLPSGWQEEVMVDLSERTMAPEMPPTTRPARPMPPASQARRRVAEGGAGAGARAGGGEGAGAGAGAGGGEVDDEGAVFGAREADVALVRDAVRGPGDDDVLAGVDRNGDAEGRSSEGGSVARHGGPGGGRAAGARSRAAGTSPRSCSRCAGRHAVAAALVGLLLVAHARVEIEVGLVVRERGSELAPLVLALGQGEEHAGPRVEAIALGERRAAGGIAAALHLARGRSRTAPAPYSLARAPPSAHHRGRARGRAMKRADLTATPTTCTGHLRRVRRVVAELAEVVRRPSRARWGSREWRRCESPRRRGSAGRR